MTIIIDLARADQLAAAAVGERGEDYVYPDPGACEYVFAPVDGEDLPLTRALALVSVDDPSELGVLKPGCIVGHAFASAGVPLERLAKCDGDVNDLTRELIDDVEVDPKAAVFFMNLQYSQDRGAPWGEALAAARNGERYRRYSDADDFVLIAGYTRNED